MIMMCGNLPPDHLLGKSEDDTKSLLQLIRVYNSLLFYHGTQKEDFDGRWKSLHIVKKSMENVVSRVHVLHIVRKSVENVLNRGHQSCLISSFSW